MNVAQHLARLGGVGSRRDLIRRRPAPVDPALRSGSVVRDGHGRYAVPWCDDGVRVAAGSNGIGVPPHTALLVGLGDRRLRHLTPK